MNNQILNIIHDFLIYLPAFLLIFSIRGFFKTLFAKFMGDDTAYQEGYLSLNPLAYIDPIALLLFLGCIFLFQFLSPSAFEQAIFFAILCFVGARWSYEIPINPSNFKRYKLGVFVTTIAGSIGNFTLSLISLYILKYMPIERLPLYATITFYKVFAVISYFSVFYGVFLLVPLPFFEGWGIVNLFRSPNGNRVIEWIEENAFYVFLFLFIMPVVSDLFFGFIHSIALFVRILLNFLVI